MMEDFGIDKRTRGNAGRKPQTEEVKKGTRPQWKPGGRLAKLDVPKDYVGRWCDKDDANISKKLEEGWIFVNKTTSPTSKQTGNDAPDKAYDGTSIASAVQYRDMVGMMLPIDDGSGKCKAARDEYINERNEQELNSRVSLEKEKNGGSGSKRFARNFKPQMTIDN